MASIISLTIGDTASSTAFCALGTQCDLDGTDIEQMLYVEAIMKKNRSFGVDKTMASKKRFTMEHYSQSYAQIFDFAAVCPLSRCHVVLLCRRLAEGLVPVGRSPVVAAAELPRGHRGMSHGFLALLICIDAELFQVHLRRSVKFHGNFVIFVETQGLWQFNIVT